MKNNFRFFLLLGGVILLASILVFTTKRQSNLPAPEQKVTSQAHPTPQDEHQKQEEEIKRFIAQYGPCRNIPILMYHHVGDNPPAGGGWLYVGKNTFVSQMDWLTQKGYTTVTLSEVMENLQAGKPLPAKPIVLTFDDGYRDVYENAYPVLRQKSFKATLFLSTQLLLILTAVLMARRRQFFEKAILWPRLLPGADWLAPNFLMSYRGFASATPRFPITDFKF